MALEVRVIHHMETRLRDNLNILSWGYSTAYMVDYFLPSLDYTILSHPV